jgi:hypothetical protein
MFIGESAALYIQFGDYLKRKLHLLTHAVLALGKCFSHAVLALDKQLTMP